MTRRVVLGALAVLVAGAAVIYGLRAIAEPPTFAIRSESAEFQVSCHGIGPGALEGSIFLDVEARGLVGPDDFREGMSDADFRLYAQASGILTSEGTADVDEYNAFVATVQEGVTSYCDQLRDNRQSGLIMVSGGALVALMLITIVAILTTPRRTRGGRGPDTSPALSQDPPVGQPQPDTADGWAVPPGRGLS